MASDQEIFDLIESTVVVQKKVCSTKWLCLHAKANVAQVQKCISGYAKKHADNLCTLLMVSGKKGNEIKIALIDESKLEDVKKKITVNSWSVYSIGPKSYGAKPEVLRETIAMQNREKLQRTVRENVSKGVLPIDTQKTFIKNDFIQRAETKI